jgi:hypothetical protein
MYMRHEYASGHACETCDQMCTHTHYHLSPVHSFTNMNACVHARHAFRVCLMLDIFSGGGEAMSAARALYRMVDREGQPFDMADPRPDQNASA